MLPDWYGITVGSAELVEEKVLAVLVISGLEGRRWVAEESENERGTRYEQKATKELEEKHI